MIHDIQPVGHDLDSDLKRKIDQKTKPPGSLGMLEEIALRLGAIQQTLTPAVRDPHVLVFAGDHGITEEGVSPYPREVTGQMVLNFLGGGAAISVFARTHGLALKVIDAGVDGDFEPHPLLVERKIARGTANFLREAAMTETQCRRAMAHGAELVSSLTACNVIAFGEMGIGNTSAAAVLMHGTTGLSLDLCVGRGTGLDDAGLAHKHEVLARAVSQRGLPSDPIALMAHYGGFELAMMTGAMLEAARSRKTILIDGFIVTAALLVAVALCPHVRDYCLFSHCSDEQGHRAMLDHLKARPLLCLDLRLGEGTGSALAFPLVAAAAHFVSDMASFEDAGVSNRDA